MKKYILTICAITFPIMLMADMFVTSKQGDVQIKKNDKWESVYVTMGIKETDSLKTEQYGKINIDDTSNRVSYTFQAEKPTCIKDLIASSKRSVSYNFLKEIYKALKNPPTYPNLPGGSPRGDETDRHVAMALRCTQQGASDYSITMTLLDLHTMQPVSQVCEGQSVAIQVNNNSDTPLFVNIIDRDEFGVETALFPTNDVQAFLDLYIPAYSSVQLDYHPYVISFSPANTTDQLTLVAYPLPFNLPNVMRIKNEINCPQEDLPNRSIGIYTASVPISGCY